MSGLIKERLGFDPVVVVAETGAPRIEGTDLCCSIAHSGDGVIVGFDEALPFGLDIEVLRQRDFDTLAAAYFHQREVSSLNDLPVEARCEEFYRLWTRKEALAKAHGQGITLGGLAEDVRGEHAGFLSLHTRRVGDFMVTTCCTDGRQPELLLAGPGVIFG
ncbi:MAG: 4'-phosphopantetheinyl transferase superfamily protein [Porticoccaceae bacterium]